MEEICKLFRNPALKSACDWAVDTFGEAIIHGLESLQTPDQICHSLKFCTGTCQLFPKSPTSKGPSPAALEAYARVLEQKKQGKEPFPLKWLIDLINKLAQNHEPIVDFDDDLFSTSGGLRGSDWRGKDCDDENRKIYPGRIDPLVNPDVDSDCNGIVGKSPQGQSYEQLFCSASDRRGIALLGDSAGAHFEIPPAWFNVSMWDNTTFDGALRRLEDEIDLPQASFSTGYLPNGTAGLLGPVNSIYLHNRQRNLCNHRDYQNSGVNGERSGSMTDLVKALARNNVTDHPVSVIYELVGNDVCHSGPDGDTPAAEFRANTLKSLRYLDDHLPPLSNVLIIGIANGSILWDALHDKIHPLGVPYPDVYNYLNCLSISPCFGWMNSNQTERHLTTMWGKMLNDVYKEIVSNQTVIDSFHSITVKYLSFPLDNYQEWYDGPLQALIEPVDGFHPNQLANAYIGDIIVAGLDKTFPGFLSKVNPQNDEIVAQFGEQLNGY